MRHIDEKLGLFPQAMRAKLGEMLEFHDSYQTDSTREAIQVALEMGSQRGPRSFEVFTHPSFPAEHQTELPTRSYQAAMLSRAWSCTSEGRAPIFLHQVGDQRRYFLPYMLGPNFITAMYPYISHAYPYVPITQRQTGFLEEADLPQLLEATSGIHPQDRFTVNGANYSQCVLQTCRQLAWLPFGVLIGEAYNLYSDPQTKKLWGDNYPNELCALRKLHELGQICVSRGVCFGEADREFESHVGYVFNNSQTDLFPYPDDQQTKMLPGNFVQ